jgi:hypothetical protein
MREKIKKIGAGLVGGITGTVTSVLAIPYFFITLGQSIYKGSNGSLTSTLALTPIISIAMAIPLLLVLFFFILHSIKCGSLTGVRHGWRAALLFPWTYFTTIQQEIKKLPHSLMIAVTFHFSFLFRVPTEIARPAPSIRRVATDSEAQTLMQEESEEESEDEEPEQKPAEQVQAAAATPPSFPLGSNTTRQVNQNLQRRGDLNSLSKPDLGSLIIKLAGLKKSTVKEEMGLDEPAIAQLEEKQQAPYRLYANSECGLSGTPIKKLTDPLTLEWKTHGQQHRQTVSLFQLSTHVIRAYDQKATGFFLPSSDKNLIDPDITFNRGFSKTIKAEFYQAMRRRELEDKIRDARLAKFRPPALSLAPTPPPTARATSPTRK